MHMDMVNEYCTDATVAHDRFAIVPQDLSVLCAASKATSSLRSAPVIFVKVNNATTRLQEAVENRSIRVVVIVAAPTPCWASGCQGAQRGNCSTSSQRDCVQRQSWKFAPSRRSVAFVVPKQTW